MAIYRLTHGSYKVGPGDYRHAGDAVELSAEEAKAMGDAVLLSVPDVPVASPIPAAAEAQPPHAHKAKRAKR